jgi:hypothetical protein
MSTRIPRPPTTARRAPARRVVATFDSYAEAERAVDALSDRGFPVERVAIVGRDLQIVEQVTGRLTTAGAALRGMVSGAVAGFFIGWLFGVFDWVDPVVATIWLAIDGLWFGALIGLVVGLVAHLLTGGRRDFSSLRTMQAAHYDLLVDDDAADEALRTLSLLDSTTPGPASTTA